MACRLNECSRRRDDEIDLSGLPVGSVLTDCTPTNRFLTQQRRDSFPCSSQPSSC
jgi:hypothetical protein